MSRVEFVKELADGTVLVNLDLSRDQVTPADQEVMVDPVILPSVAHMPNSAPVRNAVPGDGPTPLRSAADTMPTLRPVVESGPVGVYFAGRLCLERDLITNHKVWLPECPRQGDLVVFPNTGAYHMDLSAASASMHTLPAKLAVVHRAGSFQVYRDTDYEPLIPVGPPPPRRTPPCGPLPRRPSGAP